MALPVSTRSAIMRSNSAAPWGVSVGRVFRALDQRSPARSAAVGITPFKFLIAGPIRAAPRRRAGTPVKARRSAPSGPRAVRTFSCFARAIASWKDIPCISPRRTASACARAFTPAPIPRPSHDPFPSVAGKPRCRFSSSTGRACCRASPKDAPPAMPPATAGR